MKHVILHFQTTLLSACTCTWQSESRGRGGVCLPGHTHDSDMGLSNHTGDSDSYSFRHHK